MAARIIIFGATGYTGRQVAERLAAQGERPVLAGRSEARLRELAERLGGLEWRTADACAATRCSRCSSAATCSSAPSARSRSGARRPCGRRSPARGTYIDSTGEPAFIRRVFEEFGPPAARAGATLLTAMGYDFVPGALAGGAGARGGRREDAVRVDVGYYALGGGGIASARHAAVRRRRRRSTRATRSATARCAPCAHGRARAHVHRARQGPRRRSRSAGPSTSRCRPRTRGCARSTSTSAGSAALARPLQARAWPARWRCGCRACARDEGGRRALVGLASRAGPEPRLGRSRGSPPRRSTRPARGWPRCTCRAPSRYAFTAGFLAWAARRAAGAGVDGHRRARPASRRSGSRRSRRAAVRRGLDRVRYPAA